MLSICWWWSSIHNFQVSNLSHSLWGLLERYICIFFTISLQIESRMTHPKMNHGSARQRMVGPSSNHATYSPIFVQAARNLKGHSPQTAGVSVFFLFFQSWTVINFPCPKSKGRCTDTNSAGRRWSDERTKIALVRTIHALLQNYFRTTSVTFSVLWANGPSWWFLRGNLQYSLVLPWHK